MTLEENFELLEETITKLEEKDISLETSFELYKKGMDLVKECNQQIDTIEKKVLALNAEGGTDEF